MSESAVFRNARTVVAPEVPKLAPMLSCDTDIIRSQLLETLALGGQDTAQLPLADLNKLERQTIAAFVIGEQRELLVDAEQDNFQGATFRGFCVSGLTRFLGRRSWLFGKDLQSTIEFGATSVEEKFTDGPDVEHSWLPVAAKRYEELSDELAEHERDIIPEEGKTLAGGLRTKALSRALPNYLQFIRKGMKQATPAERLKAAHDLAYLVTASASLHIDELHASWKYTDLRGEIIQNDLGVYRFERAVSGSRWERVFLRKKRLPSVKMKCPATVDQNLRYLVHAAINQAPEYGLL